MSATQGVLELDGVGVTYPGTRGNSGKPALSGVTLRLEPGVVTGLVGINGAGKTTLLEVASGALRPSTGAVRWFGGETWTVGVRARLGFVPDVPGIPPLLTVAQALRLFASLSGMPPATGRIRIAMRLKQLRLDGLADTEVRKLSRGNLVRVGLAQALLGEPDLLLMDETFAPLDPQAQVEARQVIREEAARGAAILVSSHQLDQLEQVADRVLLLHDGVLGPPIEPGEFRRRRGGSPDAVPESSLEAILLGHVDQARSGQMADGAGVQDAGDAAAVSSPGRLWGRVRSLFTR